MSDCKNKEGGTHHHACACREAHFRELKALLREAREWLNGFQPFKVPGDFDAFRARLDAAIGEKK